MRLAMSRYVFPAEGAPVSYEGIERLGRIAGVDIEGIAVETGKVSVVVFGMVDDLDFFGDLLDRALGDEHHFREYDMPITEEVIVAKNLKGVSNA